MKKLSLSNAINGLTRSEMRSISGGSGSGCLARCSSSSTNSGCCSTVAATDIPYCGGAGSGRRCL